MSGVVSSPAVLQHEGPDVVWTKCLPGDDGTASSDTTSLSSHLTLMCGRTDRGGGDATS